MIANVPKHVFSFLFFVFFLFDLHIPFFYVENSRERSSDSSQIVYIVIIAVQFVIIIILAVVVIRIRLKHGSRSSQTEVVDGRWDTALQERTNTDQIASSDDVIGHYEQLNRQKDENEHTYQSLQT